MSHSAEVWPEQLGTVARSILNHISRVINHRLRPEHAQHAGAHNCITQLERFLARLVYAESGAAKATASSNNQQFSYDGDRLRLRKVDSLSDTYFLRSSVLGGQVVAELGVNQSAGGGSSYDAVSDFSNTQNPAGVWRYGYKASAGSAFTKYPSSSAPWYDPAIQDPYNLPTVGSPSAGLVYLHPGQQGQQTVVRWTAPSSGTFTISGRFEGIAGGNATTDVHVLHNSTAVFDGNVNGLGSVVPYSIQRTVTTGDTIDFAVGNGGNAYWSDSTGLAATIVPAQVTYDAAGEFSNTQNPAGAWRYGYKVSAGSAFTKYPNSSAPWYDPAISDPYNLPTVGSPSGGLVYLHPGPQGQQTVVRWTAPSSGSFTISGRFEGIAGGHATTDVHVIHNSTAVFDGYVNGLGSVVPYSVQRTVAAGDTIDFVVGDGGNAYWSDSTGLAATITGVTQGGGSGVWTRGYVYLGGQLLAIQFNSSVTWVHQEPFSKGQRLTDAGGNIMTKVEVEPWGGETAWSSNSSLQPHKFTSYERESDGGDYAMNRRYGSIGARFSQADPYDGSYNMNDPQSFNRYSYVQNDPVNFTDPSGLEQADCTDDDGNPIKCDIERISHSEWGPAFWLRFILDSQFSGLSGDRPHGGGDPGPPTPDPQNPATADAITRSDAQVDARYTDCSRHLGGSPAPSIEATKSILSTSILEGVSATLLAVTWNAESSFSSNPYSNPNDGSANNTDVGPMQINYGTFNGWASLAGLGNVFGTTTTGRQVFNGNEYDNLRAGARILNSYGGEGRTAAGRYRAGTGAFSRTPAGRAAFNARAGQYDRWAGGYDAFFNCLRR